MADTTEQLPALAGGVHRNPTPAGAAVSSLWVYDLRACCARCKTAGPTRVRPPLTVASCSYLRMRELRSIRRLQSRKRSKIHARTDTLGHLLALGPDSDIRQPARLGQGNHVGKGDQGYIGSACAAETRYCESRMRAIKSICTAKNAKAPTAITHATA